MSPVTGYSIDLADCFPRVSGDEPLKEGDTEMTTVFSPRERG